MTSTDPGNLTTKGRLYFLFRDYALYGSAAAVSRIATLVTFPIIARHLTVVDYGLLDYFQVLGAFLAILFVFGQESAIARYFYEYEDLPARRNLISQSFFFQMGCLLLLIPVLFNVLPFIKGATSEEEESVALARVLLIQVPFLVLINFSIGILRISFSRYRFVFMSVSYSFVQAILWIIGIFAFDFRVMGLMIASACASALFAAIGMFLIRSWLIIPRDWKHLKEMLPYALPYGVVCCLDAGLPILERTLVMELLGGEALGLYAAGAKVSMLFAIAAYAFQIAWSPFALALHKRPDAVWTFNWVLKFLALAACMLVLMLASLAEPLVILFASERYVSASIVVFPLVMGLAIGSVGWITEIGINFSKRTEFKLYAYAISIAVTGVTILLLAPLLELYGVALGVLAGHLAKTLALSFFAQRLYPMAWDFAPVALVVILTMVAGLLGTLAGTMWGPLGAASVFAGGGAAVAVIGGLKMFSGHERQAVIGFFREAISALRA